MVAATISHPRHYTLFILAVVAAAVLAGIIHSQQELEAHRNSTAVKLDELGILPDGKYLKPAVLGYHHITADLVWLRLIQVIGKRGTTPQEYEWLYHAMNVLTTLDPKYDYAYQVGGVVLTELAGRVDLSNQLLQKGLASNPDVWQIPFYLGYNYYFHLHDPENAAEYMTQASRLPGRPAYLPFLATRLYAEAGDPEVAVNFLTAMWRQTQDEQIRGQLETRIKELIIERDLRILEDALGKFMVANGHRPVDLKELVSQHILSTLPVEPFGGEYRYDSKTGEVTSSTHPQRLRVQKPGQSPQLQPKRSPSRRRASRNQI